MINGIKQYVGTTKQHVGNISLYLNSCMNNSGPKKLQASSSKLIRFSLIKIMKESHCWSHNVCFLRGWKHLKGVLSYFMSMKEEVYDYLWATQIWFSHLVWIMCREVVFTPFEVRLNTKQSKKQHKSFILVWDKDTEPQVWRHPQTPISVFFDKLMQVQIITKVSVNYPCLICSGEDQIHATPSDWGRGVC